MQSRSSALKSLFFAATLQALVFTGTLIGANCAVLGINPIKAVKRARTQWDSEFNSLNEMQVADVNVIPGLP